jgi:hypothetical protein
MVDVTRDRAAVAISCAAALAASIVAGCGNGEEQSAPSVTELTAQSPCNDWPAASAEARRQIAEDLKRGSQSASERLKQIDAACERYGDVSIRKALEMLAIDEHRPTG